MSRPEVVLGPGEETLALAPESVSAPTVSGLAVQGRTLTEHHGGWEGEVGTYSYKWLRCKARTSQGTGGSCGAIPGASGQSYTLAQRRRGDVDRGAGDRRQQRRLERLDLRSRSKRSRPKSPLNTRPAGHHRHDPAGPDADACAKARWTNNAKAPAWQWLRCGATGSGCTAIAGATKKTYKLEGRRRGPRRWPSAKRSKTPSGTARRRRSAADARRPRSAAGARRHLAADDHRLRPAGADADRARRRLDGRTDQLLLRVEALLAHGHRMQSDLRRHQADLPADLGGRGAHDRGQGNGRQRRRLHARRTRPARRPSRASFPVDSSLPEIQGPAQQEQSLTRDHRDVEQRTQRIRLPVAAVQLRRVRLHGDQRRERAQLHPHRRRSWGPRSACA